MPARTAPTTAKAGLTYSRASQSAARRADIAAIHAAAHALGMDTADQNPQTEYRSLLLQVGGHLSAADMTPEQRQAVKRHLQGLQRREGQGTLSQADFVLLLWKQLGELGALTDPSATGLAGFLQKHGSASHPRLMGLAQGSKAIEALKAWVKRAKAAPAKAGQQ